MAEHMTAVEIQAAFTAAGAARTVLEQHDWDAVSREASRTGALAPILQPTWYSGAMGRVAQVGRLAQAAKEYLAALDEIESRLGDRRG